MYVLMNYCNLRMIVDMELQWKNMSLKLTHI